MTEFSAPTSERAPALLTAAEQCGDAGDRDLHIDLLWLLALRATWTDPGPAVRSQLVEAAARLGDARAEDPRVVAIHAFVDPLGHAPDVLARLQDAVALAGVDPDSARQFGAAAFIIGAFDLALPFLRTAVDGLRRRTARAPSARAHVVRGVRGSTR